jgi:hypothetical protein
MPQASCSRCPSRPLRNLGRTAGPLARRGAATAAAAAVRRHAGSVDPWQSRDSDSARGARFEWTCGLSSVRMDVLECLDSTCRKSLREKASRKAGSSRADSAGTECCSTAMCLDRLAGFVRRSDGTGCALARFSCHRPQRADRVRGGVRRAAAACGYGWRARVILASTVCIPSRGAFDASKVLLRRKEAGVRRWVRVDVHEYPGSTCWNNLREETQPEDIAASLSQDRRPRFSSPSRQFTCHCVHPIVPFLRPGGKIPAEDTKQTRTLLRGQCRASRLLASHEGGLCFYQTPRDSEFEQCLQE